MVGTDRWTVHSFAAPYKIGCQFVGRSRGTLTEGNEGKEGFNLELSSLIAEDLYKRQNLWQSRFPPCHVKRHALVHNTPNNLSGPVPLLVSDQQAQSVVAITFKFSVVALLSLVPGKANSLNQVRFGLAFCVNDVALSV
jgi:hypothetical protein